MNGLKQHKSVVLEREAKAKFQQSVADFYADLEFMTSRLRREIILMDKKTAFSQTSEEDVSLLPITIDKKAAWVGDWKFRSEVEETKKLLGKIESKRRYSEVKERTKNPSEEQDVEMVTVKTEPELKTEPEVKKEPDQATREASKSHENKPGSIEMIPIVDLDLEEANSKDKPGLGEPEDEDFAGMF